MRSSNYVRLCTVWASTLCFCVPLCSVADDVSQINARVLEILYLQQALRTAVVDDIQPDVDGIANALAYLNHNNDDQLAVLSAQLSQLTAIAAAVTNRPGGAGGDALDGNPWWVTNSAFAVTWSDLGTGVPVPIAPTGWSFPEVLSFLTASRVRYEFGEFAAAWDSFGYGTDNSQNGVFTFEDWMADAMRSNLVLHASLAGTTDAPEAVDTAATAAVDDGGTDGTNAVPEMVIERMDVGGVEGALELVDAQAVGDMLPSSFSEANPEILVFSGGRYGDVDVPEVRASLAIPEDVARYIRGVATWLWRVALFVGCFVIVKQEVAYWSTLGGSTSDA